MNPTQIIVTKGRFDWRPSASKIPILIRHKGHYFIGADNGLFSLLFDQKPEEIFANLFHVFL